jgi:hypothetical protein
MRLTAFGGVDEETHLALMCSEDLPDDAELPFVRNGKLLDGSEAPFLEDGKLPEVYVCTVTRIPWSVERSEGEHSLTVLIDESLDEELLEEYEDIGQTDTLTITGMTYWGNPLRVPCCGVRECPELPRVPIPPGTYGARFYRFRAPERRGKLARAHVVREAGTWAVRLHGARGKCGCLSLLCVYVAGLAWLFIGWPGLLGLLGAALASGIASALIQVSKPYRRVEAAQRAFEEAWPSFLIVLSERREA